MAYTENALGMQEGSAGYIRLFDIKIVDKNDHNGNGGTTETGSTTIGESYLVNKTFNILGEVHLHSWNHPDRACRSRAVDEEEKESIKFALPVEKHPSS